MGFVRLASRGGRASPSAAGCRLPPLVAITAIHKVSVVTVAVVQELPRNHSAYRQL